MWWMPKHRRRAVDHLSAAFGDEKTPEEIERLADRALASVVMFAVEVVCLPRLMNAFTWRRYIHLVDFTEALELFMSRRGAILVTGHYGSFEVRGQLLAALGFDLVTVMRPLDNVYLNEFLVRTRRTHGLTMLDKKGAMQSAESILQDGSLLCFIGDQDAGRKGVFVDFFGRPASTHRSPALLSLKYGTPIILAEIFREKGVHHCVISDPLYPDDFRGEADPVTALTQAVTAKVEAAIRAHPDQWFWVHDRWKTAERAARAETQSATAAAFP